MTSAANTTETVAVLTEGLDDDPHAWSLDLFRRAEMESGDTPQWVATIATGHHVIDEDGMVTENTAPQRSAAQYELLTQWADETGHGLDLDGTEATGETLHAAIVPPATVRQVAADRDVTPGVVMALVDQLIDIDGDEAVIHDDEGDGHTLDLGRAGTATNVTLTGRAVIDVAEQLSATAGEDPLGLLAEAAEAAEAFRAAEVARHEAGERRAAAFKAAAGAGIEKTRIAEAARLSRETVHKIIR